MLRVIHNHEEERTMDTMNKVKNDANEYVKKGKEEVKQSAQDWFDYVQEHPFQTLVFGAAIYFALKGMVKELIPMKGC